MRKIFIILMLSMLLSITAEAQSPYPTPEQAKQELKTFLPQYAISPKDVGLLKQIGLCYHAIGSAGDADAVIKSIEYLNKAIRVKPNDNELKAWLGSAVLMRARDVWVLEQPGYVNRGSAIIDAAIASEPDNIEIRWIRVNTYSHLPSFLGKDNIVIADFEFILKKLQGSDDKGVLQDTYYRLGQAYKKVNNTAKAKENFRLARNIDNSSELAKKISKEDGL